MNVVNSNDIFNVSWEARKSGFIAGFIVGGASVLLAYRKMKKIERKLSQQSTNA